MADITAAAVKALREKTDLPMMDCKKALVKAEGDEAKAIEILQEQVGKILGKRAENSTDEGRIFTKFSDDGSTAVAVELLCESAPVAGSEALGAFAEKVVDHVMAADVVAQGEALLNEGDLMTQYNEMVNKIREKIVVGRAVKIAGPVGVYVHHDGKTAVLLEAEGEAKSPEALRDVAMHVAAMKPTVATIDDVDASLVQEERDRLTAEAKATGKPDNIIDKIVDGRMGVFYRDTAGVLTEQPFAKDDSKTVSQYLAENGLKAKAFTLLVLGKTDEA